MQDCWSSPAARGDGGINLPAVSLSPFSLAGKSWSSPRTGCEGWGTGRGPAWESRHLGDVPGITCMVALLVLPGSHPTSLAQAGCRWLHYPLTQWAWEPTAWRLLPVTLGTAKDATGCPHEQCPPTLHQHPCLHPAASGWVRGGIFVFLLPLSGWKLSSVHSCLPEVWAGGTVCHPWMSLSVSLVWGY